MKRLLSFCVALFFATTALWAYDFKSGDLYYNITDATDLTVEVTYEVLAQDETMDNYAGLTTATIPATVSYNGNNYRVTGVGMKAFRLCPTLTSVTIPNSVTSIGYDAFSLCPSLFSINIPNSVTTIASAAFYSIPNVVYSGEATGSPWGACGVNGYIEGDLVYIDNTKTWLRACNRAATGDITIPNGVTTIQTSAFARCSGITSVTIPNSVTQIGNFSFGYCTSLTSVTIPKSVTTIASQAFQACTGLTSIVVESGNTVYDSRDNCNAIIETSTNRLRQGCKTTVIPNSVTSIGGYAFSGHSTLTDIHIPNSVTEIGSSAFESCSSLTAVTIPSSVTKIGDWAFSGCSGLTAITIPSSVTSIGAGAFTWCEGLTSMVVESGNTVYDSRENCNAIIETATHSILCGCKTTVIPNSVTSIGDDAFQGCTTLTSMTIPNSITSIGEWAFYYCTGLTAITIPNSVTSIGAVAFEGCTSLASVTIGNSVTSIEGYAFYNCSSLTSLYMLPSTPPTLGTSVFDNVPTDISVYVPCGTLTAYQAATTWSDFTNYKEWTGYMLTVTSQDDAMGSVRISQEATCTNNTATFEAIPNTNYRFKQWNDGNTDNPRTITLDDNMSFVAQFESAPTALDQTRIDNNTAAQKMMRNGQVYIFRGGKTYTTTGIEVK